MANYDDVNTPLVALIGFLGAILVFAIVVFLAVLVNTTEQSQEYLKNVSRPYAELDNLVAAERIKLAEYRWVDQQKRLVAIPIQRAMELVVAQYGGERGPAPTGSSAAKEGGQK